MSLPFSVYRETSPAALAFSFGEFPNANGGNSSFLPRRPSDSVLRGKHFSNHGCSLSLPPAAIPTPVHVIVVIEENHGYSQIIGSGQAPYINSLATQGALFTNSFAVKHPSEPNYLALFSDRRTGLQMIPVRIPLQGDRWRACCLLRERVSRVTRRTCQG